MEVFLAVVLIGGLALVAGRLIIVGLHRMRRTNRIARRSHRAGMRFFAEDSFDLPVRHQGVSLLQAGHDASAGNVSEERVGRWRISTFDLCFEIGRGLRRGFRQYAVAAGRCSGVLSRTDLLRVAEGVQCDGFEVEITGGGMVIYAPVREPGADHRTIRNRLRRAVEAVEMDAGM